MQQRSTWRVLAAVVLGLVAAGAWLGLAWAQSEPGNDPMAQMMKYAAPGEHHKHLARMVGKWNSKGKFWMEPGKPPAETTGTAEFVPVLDGRFIQQNYHGTFMGQPFVGSGLEGYDNFKQKHIATWVDNMGTALLSFEGSCAQGGKVVTLSGELDDPASGQHTKMRNVTTWQNDNQFTMESFGPGPDGKEVKMFELVYTRAS
ncbi:MAG TPA: DUF1579 domain-containing protein [Candidatus Polarisedimenticolaceae bacterium]|nr:DUF1579 domain-containing protein [Candidatus Polarisedimenticolaceae bacterium]